MAHFPFLQIRFLANDKQTEDHRLDVKRSGGEYLWVYRAPDLTHTETVVLKNREEVFERLEIMADLLGLDEDPFKHFQVFIPGMPTILSSIGRFQKSIGILQRAMANTFDNWPMRCSWDEMKQLDQDDCHDEDSLYSEEDEEDEDHEDHEEGEVSSTDSDMPPLETPRRSRELACPCAPMLGRYDFPDADHNPSNETEQGTRVRRRFTTTEQGTRVHLTFD